MLCVFINWVCAIVFVFIAFSSFRRKSPMNFWSGTEVREEQVTDVKKYNYANGVLWLGYSLFFWIAGLLSFTDTSYGMLVSVLGCTVGLVYLVLGYRWIKHRYFVECRAKYIAGKLNDYR